MNYCMFLPQVAEQDTYDVNGHQIDDINSVAEFIGVALGFDHTADDEDDDSGQNFHIVKALDYFYQPTQVAVETAEFDNTGNHLFSDYIKNHLHSVSIDIVSPPPDAA